MSTTPSAAVTEAVVLDALRDVQDPDRGEDIVTVGLVKDLHIHDADVTFTLAFTGQSPAAKVVAAQQRHEGGLADSRRAQGAGEDGLGRGAEGRRAPTGPHRPRPTSFPRSSTPSPCRPARAGSARPRSP